jgi:ribosomal protein S18 acetylase RimI-like enzyme
VNTSVPELRKANLSDLSELLALARTSFLQAFTVGNKPENVQAYLAEAFTKDKLTKEMQEAASTFIVASLAGKLLGYTKLNLAAAQADVQDPSSVEVARLYTLEEVWGTGLGQLLLDEAFAFGRQEGKTWLWLGVWEHNARAIRFYEKNGLRIFGSHPFPFGDEIQTDWLMRVDL